MHLTKVLLIILLAGLLQSGYSQNRRLQEMIDSSAEAKDDTLKVNLLLDICDSLYRPRPGETINYGIKALELSKRLNYEKGIAYSLKYIGTGYSIMSEYVRAIDYFQQALERFELMGSKKGISNMLNSLGVVYNFQGNDAKALDAFQQSLRISEEIKDPLREASALINVGQVYSKKESTVDKANEYYLKAFGIAENHGFMDPLGTVTVNLGDLYFNKGKYKEALFYFEKSLDAFRKTKTGNLSYSLISIGKIYSKMDDYRNAIKFQEEAYKIALESKAVLEMAQALMALAHTYKDMGEISKAIEYYKRAESLAIDIDANAEKREIYSGMATAYFSVQDYRNAFLYQLKETTLKDTISSRANEEQLNNLRVQFEIDSMLKENEILKNETRLKDTQSRLQVSIIVFLVIGVLLISVFLILLLRSINHKKRINEELNMANAELKGAFDLVNAQKRQIETAHTEITASIRYAKYIQSSVLPRQSQRESIMGEHFILYLPKQIVSGDFYWCSKVGNQSVIAVGDCTGHGVPGAFMSMLGIALLNEIVNKERITHPGVILHRLRNEVIQSLQQQGDTNEIKDGMDLAVCVIDNDRMSLSYAGANSPMYLVRKKEGACIENTRIQSMGSNVLYEFRGDRMPASIYVSMENFSMQELPLEDGDIIYMFSDGYADQFGGPNFKKMQFKNFRQIILLHSNEPMEFQKLSLENELNYWKGDNSQMDDIVVAGIRIGKKD